MSVIKRSDLITDEAFQWPKDYAAQLDILIKKSKELGTGTTKKNTTELAKVQRQLSVATERSDDKYKQLKATLLSKNKVVRDSIKDIQNEKNAYDRLSKELNDTRKAYKNLAVAGKENTKEAKAQLAAIKRLDRQLKKVDNTVGQNQRSVGKYSNALKGVTARFLGWAAAIALVGRALIDAFSRIRQYDKAIVELSGVLRVSRKDLADLEKLIISVAGSSTKTSTEVAQLASALATLGKSKAEIGLLLKPVNDLSISLKATSEEAGKLLVGTLNAFGESAIEGKRFAEVIANMRISSSLDFEQIKDSLGFIAPTAKAVGLSIEGLGARIGVLVDNTVKASRAGRLLNTAFLRLASNGKTLEDALDEVNAAQDRGATSLEVLKITGELFGTNAAGIGLILANNRDKVAELTEEYKKSQGVLDELTAKQLTSLDAKLKILDSSWEKLILSFTTGDNWIAKDFKASISTLSGWFVSLADAITGTDSSWENFKNNTKESIPSNEELTFSLDNLNEKLQEQRDILEKINTQEGIHIDRSLQTKRVTDEKIVDIKRQIVFLNELLESNKEVDRLAALAAKIEAEDKAKIEAELAKKAADEKLRLQQDANKKIAAEETKAQSLLHDLRAEGVEDTKSEFLKEVEAKQESNDRIKRIEQKLANDLKAINKRVTDSNQDASDERVRIAEEEAEKKEEAEKLLADTKKAIIDKSFEAASELGNRFTDLRLQQIESEITALEFARNRELEGAGDNERAKFAINKRFDDQRKELQRKQVITERANALFNIAIGTAQSIIKTGATLGYPAAIPFVALAAAIGAIQAAAVIAAPIPQFDEGKESTPKDYIAGEKRPELRKSKGNWSLINKPTLFKDSPGDKIVSGKETDSILGTMADITGGNILTDQKSILSLLNNEYQFEKRSKDNIAFILKRNNEDLIRTIKNKKEVNLSVNTSGTKVYEKSGNIIVNRIDHYYKR